MPNQFSVPKCSGRGGFSFLSDPEDPEQRLKWKEAIKITWTPTAWSTVCVSHLKPDDIKDSIRGRAEEPAKKRRRVLKSTAVPSIFNVSLAVNPAHYDPNDTARISPGAAVDTTLPEEDAADAAAAVLASPSGSASPHPGPSHEPDDTPPDVGPQWRKWDV